MMGHDAQQAMNLEEKKKVATLRVSVPPAKISTYVKHPHRQVKCHEP
jgi:hypothetical protein